MNIKNQKGAIFVLSLMVMMILVILSSVFIFRAITEKNLSDRERKLAQALLIGESGANAGLEQIDTLINTYMLTTINGTNPSTVSSKASTYFTSGDGLGFLNEFVKNAGVAQLTISGSQATYTKAATSAGGGTYQYTIYITEKNDPAKIGDSIWDFSYNYRIDANGTKSNIPRNLKLSGDFTVRVQKDNFAKYALFTNAQTLPNGTNVWFTGKTNFAGPLHTNGRYNVAFNPSGVFDGAVTQTDTYTRFYNNGSSVNLNAANNGTIDVPTFNSTFTRGATTVTLSSSVAQSDMQNQASGNTTISTDGIYVPNNGTALTGGIYIHGDSTVSLAVTGGNAVYTVVQGGTTKTITVDKVANNTTVVSGGTPTTYTGLPNGVDNLGTLIYTEGNITSLGGTIQTATELTISASSDVVIQNNLVYEDYTAAVGTPGTVGYVAPNATNETNLLGIVSWSGNVRVGSSAPDDVNIHASILAKNGYFQVDNYNAGSPRGTATVLGGVISNYYGAFGTFNSSTGVAVSGYGRNFVYDTRMEDHEAPPYFPTLNTFIAFTNDIADKIAWQEGG
jgi:hypothetical protein